MIRIVILAIMIACTVGCSSVRPPSTEELHAIEQPSPANAAWLESLGPLAVAWFSEQEKELLPHGRPLNADEVKIARQMGVQHPDRVRVIIMREFPLPDDPILFKELKTLGLGSPLAGGRSLGYAVLIKPKYENQPWLLAHELVHVGQRERFGTEAFIRRYLLELRVFGYARAPLEIEANRGARD